MVNGQIKIRWTKIHKAGLKNQNPHSESMQYISTGDHLYQEIDKKMPNRNVGGKKKTEI